MVSSVIRSFKNSATERFAEGGRSRFSGLDEQKARLRLDQLNAAVTPQSLGALKSVGLHRLKGERAGFWAVTVNGPWHLVFIFKDGDAYDVEIVDYH
jgi:proteic killer suppression protein